MSLASEMVTRLRGGARTETEVGPFTIVTDQARHSGGEGSAPSPFSVFLATIGACAGAYVHAFCRPRGLPAENIRIVQTMTTDPATGMVTNVDLVIQLPADFPEKYREPLLRTVEHCTIKKHLETPPRITMRAERESCEPAR
jgi:ribosomal protein S12 methylthiotransferase accessory factor